MGKLNTLKPKVKTLNITIVESPGTKRIEGRAATIIRKRILERDEYTCTHCHRLLSPHNLEVDHIVPLHLGGAESDDNRQTLCKSCHKVKSDQEERNRQNG